MNREHIEAMQDTANQNKEKLKQGLSKKNLRRVAKLEKIVEKLKKDDFTFYLFCMLPVSNEKEEMIQYNYVIKLDDYEEISGKIKPESLEKINRVNNSFFAVIFHSFTKYSKWFDQFETFDEKFIAFATMFRDCILRFSKK